MGEAEAVEERRGSPCRHHAMNEKPVILTRHEEGPRAIHDNRVAGETGLVNGSGSFGRLCSHMMTGFSCILAPKIVSEVFVALRRRSQPHSLGRLCYILCRFAGCFRWAPCSRK